ncbi:MAG: hypothetical protein ABIG37_00435 [Nanoarchaeota archaeon]
MAEKVQAILILEIMGKPAEHISETLNKIIENLEKEKDTKLINKVVAEPKEIKEQEGIFSSFAEVEIETDIGQLLLIIFAYMPSHIEILEPENLRIKNSDLNIFLNELLKKLHQYDEMAKAFMIERQILSKRIENGEIIIKEQKQNKKKSSKKKKSKKTKNNNGVSDTKRDKFL